MSRLPARIMELAEALPEGAPIRPNTLLHLGNRPAINQALSRLVRRGLLMRIYRGVYMRTIETPYGRRSPYESKVIQSLSKLWGETIASNGGAAANLLGLCTQNVVTPVYWTSGPNRRLRHGKRTINLHHVPRWQLAAADRPAGLLLRALAWLGPKFPQEIEDALETVVPRLPAENRKEFGSLRAIMPAWLAQPVSMRLPHG